MLAEFNESIQKLNYRPLVISQPVILEILRDARFDKMGFYLVPLKTTGLRKQVFTIRYILFNNLNQPFNFDGEPTTLSSSSLLKSAGTSIPGATNTSFVIPRNDLIGKNLHHIFGTSDATLASTSLEPEKFVVFMLVDKDPRATTMKFELTYGVIERWGGGIGGPASTATSPAP